MCGCRKGARQIRSSDGTVVTIAAPPEPELPSNAVWGPLAWKILHACAEQTVINKRHISTRWTELLDSLSRIIPCSECKDHFSSYMSKNKFRPPSSGPEFKNYVRTWLHTFHNNVNARLGHPEFNAADLESTYSSMNVAEYVDAFKQVMAVFVNARMLRNHKVNSFLALANVVITP